MYTYDKNLEMIRPLIALFMFSVSAPGGHAKNQLCQSEIYIFFVVENNVLIYFIHFQLQNNAPMPHMPSNSI
jgi:hypothetical protein